jgi:AraC family transcriptional regulator
MNALSNRFRGETLRSIQMNGLALVESRFRRGTIVPKHHHDQAYISFLFAGAYIERLTSTERCCCAAAVIWHPPDESHEDRFVSDGHILNLAFKDEWLEDLPPEVTLPDKACWWEGGLPYRFGLELYQALNRDGQISHESVVNLVSFCASRRPTRVETAWLNRVLDWMNDEYCCTLTLTQASELARVHPVHIARSFRRLLGCTFREYLTLIRLRRATDLLKGLSANITEVALACGFSDHAHFTRTFKGATGLTPTAYRTHKG